MSRLVLCFALAALAPISARADLPEFPNVIVPAHIKIVGHVSGTADGAGQFGVRVMDHASLPIAGSIVVVDFSNAPDVRLATDVVAPGAIVDCPTRTIRSVTNAEGWATFTIVGGSTPVGAQCVEGSSCEVRIYADGVLIARIGASVLDLDGATGFGGGDLALWLADFATGHHPMRSDHNGDAYVGGSDLALWLGYFGSGASQQSAASTCP